MPNLIKLTKPWANHPAGAKFTVLATGENPAPGSVDPARAATLIADGLAAEESAPAAKSPTSPATQRTRKEA